MPCSASVSVGLKEVFHAGCTWVVTDGEDNGAMQLVGDSMPDEHSKAKVDDRCPSYIGVCTWGRVLNSECLQRKDPESREYILKNIPESSTESGRHALNSKLKHFLMIDDGTQRHERTHEHWLQNFLSYMEEGGKHKDMQLLNAVRYLRCC